MPDTHLNTAIHKSVDSARQQPALADKLVAWFEALVAGNEALEDRENVQRRLESLLEATRTEEADLEEE